MPINSTIYRARLIEVNYRLNKTINDLYAFGFALSTGEQWTKFSQSIVESRVSHQKIELLKLVKDEKIPALVEMIKVLSCAQTAFELINDLGGDEAGSDTVSTEKVDLEIYHEAKKWIGSEWTEPNCSLFMERLSCDLYYLYNEVVNLVEHYNCKVPFDTFQSWLENTNVLVLSNDRNVGFLIRALNRMFSILRREEFKIKSQLS